MKLSEALEPVSMEELRMRGWSAKRIKGYLKARGKVLKRFKLKAKRIALDGGIGE